MFGLSPGLLGQSQNNFVLQLSSTWISNPMTASNSITIYLPGADSEDARPAHDDASTEPTILWTREKVN
jgi:hypothetical protein